MRTRIKICGIRSLSDVDILNRYAPDYAGFVFAESRRQVDGKTALTLRKALRSDIKAVGVFVNEEAEFILKLLDEGAIDAVQLHGDEDETYVARLKRRTPAPIIKAVRLKSETGGGEKEENGAPNPSGRETENALKSCADYLLFDAYDSRFYGGTGKPLNAAALPKTEKPFFLAGGLNSENVAEYLKFRPFGVDVSGGSEREGVKDEAKIAAFTAAVRGAANNLTEDMK